LAHLHPQQSAAKANPAVKSTAIAKRTYFIFLSPDWSFKEPTWKPRNRCRARRESGENSGRRQKRSLRTDRSRKGFQLGAYRRRGGQRQLYPCRRKCHHRSRRSRTSRARSRNRWGVTRLIRLATTAGFHRPRLNRHGKIGKKHSTQG